MCPLRSLVRGLLSGGLLDIDEPGWSLKGSCLTRARHLPATLLLNKQRHVSPLFYNNAHMENANGWDVLVCCVCAWLFISLPLSVFLCVSLCLCSLCVCMFEWLTGLSCPGNVCGAPLPSCRPPTVMHWSDTTDASAQVLVNTGRHKFWRRDKNKPRYRRRDTKGQPDSTLSGEKGQRVKEGDDCNCCNSTDLSLGFHDHDRSLTRCSTTQNTRVTCYKGCLRLHPFDIDKGSTKKTVFLGMIPKPADLLPPWYF